MIVDIRELKDDGRISQEMGEAEEQEKEEKEEE